MHCTSMYPTPFEKVRLGAIAELREAFQVPVGFSDHSLGIAAALGAVALGACCVEKHFTISRSWPGPDCPISIEPQELRQLCEGAQALFAARGGRKTILPEEQPVIDFAYASVVSIRPIRKGEQFSSDNVWVKRPGVGAFLAKDLPAIFGKRAARDVQAAVSIHPDDLEPPPA
jgi:N-acetylneuraminate synthase